MLPPCKCLSYSRLVLRALRTIPLPNSCSEGVRAVAPVEGVVVVLRIAGRDIVGMTVAIADVSWRIENGDSVQGKMVWYRLGERLEYIHYRDGGDGDDGAKAGCKVRDGIRLTCHGIGYRVTPARTPSLQRVPGVRGATCVPLRRVWDCVYI